ncbi:MAG: hypothetical protein DHS20C21_05230 [Gemmatimonadota bacterium]|nr:MAG: hypothetical protein DHS20C21_05230 [Gemmatimonadota bacterium]
MASVKRIQIRDAEKPIAALPAKPIPRVTRLMALAIWFDEMIRTGDVKDYAELARIGKVSRARVTQIMDLLCLAPTTQAELLAHNGAGLPTERAIRERADTSLWQESMRLTGGTTAPWPHRRSLSR